MTTYGQRNSSRPSSPRGPLSGVPVTLQWIGVVAALVAAGFSLQHLYFEITEQPRGTSAVEPQRAPIDDPAVPAVGEAWFERPEPDPSEVAQQPIDAIVTPAPSPELDEPGPVADPIDAYLPVEEPTAVYLPYPVVQDSPEPAVEEVIYVPVEHDASLEERLRTRLGDPQELTDYSLDERGFDDAESSVDTDQAADSFTEETVSSAEADPSDSPEPTEPLPPSGPPDSVGGVAVVSLRWNGRDIDADVRENKRIDVTVIRIGGLGETRPESGASPVPADVGAPHVADTSSGVYYFRVFVGSTGDSLDPDSHALLGKDLRVLPSVGSESRTDRPGASDLVGGLNLRTAVAFDPVWLPADGVPAQSDFVAAAGRKLYDISVSGAPSSYDGWHVMQIKIAHRNPDRRGSQLAELEVLVQQDRFVVLAVPDLLPPARYYESNPSIVDMAVVAFAPLAGQGANAIRAMASMFEEDPRDELIAIEGPQPVVPVELFSDRASLGDVRLRVLVSAIGESLSVVAIETDGPSGELLVEPIVSAVRQWRFHPPRLERRNVAGYFEFLVGSGLEMQHSFNSLRIGDPEN